MHLPVWHIATAPPCHAACMHGTHAIDQTAQAAAGGVHHSDVRRKDVGGAEARAIPAGQHIPLEDRAAESRQIRRPHHDVEHCAHAQEPVGFMWAGQADDQVVSGW